MKKVALITGASSGIGESIAKKLIAEGWTVYAAARRLDRMADLRREGARLLSLDLTDDESIRESVHTVLNDSGRIDALINNAGYGSYGALEDVPLDEARRQTEVNLFGPGRLIQLALPAMRSQGSGTIVNVSSIGGKIHEPLGAWYHATKFALEGLSDCLRMELEPFGVNVVVIQPGAIKTEWGSIARQTLLERSASGAYSELARRVASMLEAADRDSGSSPDVVAKAVFKALSSKRPKTRYVIGGGAKPLIALRWLLNDRAFDSLMVLAAKMLEKSNARVASRRTQAGQAS
jgi:NAD(P)-dependent dehydrogenase (short-subunit alcohol dehydrogenase family)